MNVCIIILVCWKKFKMFAAIFSSETIDFQKPKLWLWFRGALVVIGGFLVHLSLGTIYTFGNMAPYVISYIRNQSHPENLKQEATTWIFAFALAGQGGCMFIGGWMVRQIGPRWTTLIGGWLMSLGVALSFLTVKLSFYALLFTYGLMFGMGVGIAYIGPLSSAMNWMPKWKGLANGIVVAGFGLGALIFNAIQTSYINPWNVKPTPHDDGDKYFTDPRLISRVPTVFLILGGTYAVMQFVGSMLIINPPEDYNTVSDPDPLEEQEKIFKSGQYEEVDDNSVKKGLNSATTVFRPSFTTNGSINGKSKNRIQSSPNESPLMRTPVQNLTDDSGIKEETSRLVSGNQRPAISSWSSKEGSLSLSASVSMWSSNNVVVSLRPLQMLKKVSFYLLWYMFLANGMSTLFIATLYKFFGLTFTSNDHFLASVGSVSAIFNCSGRIVWGFLADKVSYKFSLVLLSGIMTVFTLTLYACSAVGEAMFFIWICVIFFCIGGNFSLFPTAIGRAFGLQYVSINYGLLFTSQVVAGSVGALLSTVLKTHIGFDGLLFVVSGFSCSTFLLVLLYKPKRYISLNQAPNAQ